MQYTFHKCTMCTIDAIDCSNVKICFNPTPLKFDEQPLRPGGPVTGVIKLSRQLSCHSIQTVKAVKAVKLSRQSSSQGSQPVKAVKLSWQSSSQLNLWQLAFVLGWYCGNCQSHTNCVLEFMHYYAWHTDILSHIEMQWLHLYVIVTGTSWYYFGVKLSCVCLVFAYTHTVHTR